MIRINLLGKKKAAAVPFGLDEQFDKLGINISDLQEMRPAIVRLAVIAVGLYIGNFVPTYLHDERLRQLDADLAKITSKVAELQKELSSKKDIRKQMEQLNKEEVELNRQLSAVSALQLGRVQAFKALDEIMIQLNKTPKVWLDDLKYEKGVVNLSGRSWEFFPVNDFVKSISESTRFSGVKFKEITTEAAKTTVAGVPEQKQKTKKFALEFSIKEGE